MSFRYAKNIRQSLVQEIVLNTCKLNPDYPFAFALDGDEADSQIETISYHRFALDIVKVAKELEKSIPKRHFGTAIQNVGVLGRSRYSYAVHWMACLFNSWIVCNSSTGLRLLIMVPSANFDFS